MGNLLKVTKAELLALPKFNEGINAELIFDNIIILPTRRKHSSGHRVMHFVACINGVPTFRLCGASDTLSIDIEDSYINTFCLPCGVILMDAPENKRFRHTGFVTETLFIKVIPK